MMPPIPSPMIVPIDEGSPLQKPSDIKENPLVSSPPKIFIDENMQHIISALKKPQEKGKKPILEVHLSEPPPKQNFGWSQDKIE